MAQVTVAVVEPLIVPLDCAVAVTEVLPTLTPINNPDALIVATLASPVLHKTVAEPVLPSSKVAVAVICWVLPCITEGVAGLTVTAVRTGFTKNPVQPAANASSKSAVNAANSWSFRLVLGMV